MILALLLFVSIPCFLIMFIYVLNDYDNSETTYSYKEVKPQPTLKGVLSDFDKFLNK